MLVNEHDSACLTDISVLIMWADQCVEECVRICPTISKDCCVQSRESGGKGGWTVTEWRKKGPESGGSPTCTYWQGRAGGPTGLPLRGQETHLPKGAAGTERPITHVVAAMHRERAIGSRAGPRRPAQVF